MCSGSSSGMGIYIECRPEEPGVRCLRMELSLSPAILNIGIIICFFGRRGGFGVLSVRRS